LHQKREPSGYRPEIEGSALRVSTIRPFAEPDAPQVRDLFIAVNRMLAPTHLRDAFENYIARSLSEEIDRILDYYRDRGGGLASLEAGSTV
jgi:hypothetical protein